jgi:alkanesulfonate monooxygenase SsuD/methylene tetrahydromethanopterin reductase-like flavin-dependent oxidoreductase (luciferase family)
MCRNTAIGSTGARRPWDDGAAANLTGVRVGLVILPSDRWRLAQRQWEWADDVGFCTAWTYDHVRWGGMPDGPWLAAVPILAAAAGVTGRIRLGTLVATPNFRHPVPLARDVLALDDLSDGRIDLGVGPGSEGPDASALGEHPLSPSDRMERFGEFLHVLREVLNGGAATRTSFSGAHFSSVDAPSTPGTRQQPLPLTVAAGGSRGLGLAATYGQQWVTIGPSRLGPKTPADILSAVTRQCALVELACASSGRNPAELRKVVLWTPTEPVIDSVDQFDDLAGPYVELGVDQFVLHHPAQTGPYGGSVPAFEQIAARQHTT